jgi:hypothetical protein
VSLFGARRLSQQSHSFFPEPLKGYLPVYTMALHKWLFWHAPPSAVYCNHLASLGYSCSGIGQTTTTQYVAAVKPASIKMGA